MGRMLVVKMYILSATFEIKNMNLESLRDDYSIKDSKSIDKHLELYEFKRFLHSKVNTNSNKNKL